jgi:hypothetical protein
MASSVFWTTMDTWFEALRYSDWRGRHPCTPHLRSVYSMLIISTSSRWWRASLRHPKSGASPVSRAAEAWACSGELGTVANQRG